MAESKPALSADSFWDTVRARSREALRTGALRPISTKASFVQDHGVEFVVRVSDNLLRKQSAPSPYRHPEKPNPFLPPDPELTIGCLAPHHVALLNKFNVIESHVLVVTRTFAHQESPLTVGDFAAVAPGLEHGGGLAFYNGGKVAGASQPHKHFQLIPLPLGRGPAFPTAALLDGASAGINTVAPFRFRHAFTVLDPAPADPSAFGRACHDAYGHALQALGVADTPGDGEETRLPPYNLLLTHRWLFIAPRRTEHHLGISVNGLGYAGSLFVDTTEKLEQIGSKGPMAILERVSLPPT